MAFFISHGAFIGTYESFFQWRRTIAWCIGIDLLRMQGFEKSSLDILEHYKKVGSPPGLVYDYEKAVTYDPMPWRGIIDPLKYLLKGDKQDGELSPEICGLVANRLEEILGVVPTNSLYITDKFIKGCRKANELGQPLVWS